MAQDAVHQRNFSWKGILLSGNVGKLVVLLMGLVTVKLNNTIISTNSNAKGVVTATKGVLESVVLPTNQPESTTSGGIRGSSHRHPPWL